MKALEFLADVEIMDIPSLLDSEDNQAVICVYKEEATIHIILKDKYVCATEKFCNQGGVRFDILLHLLDLDEWEEKGYSHMEQCNRAKKLLDFDIKLDIPEKDLVDTRFTGMKYPLYSVRGTCANDNCSCTSNKDGYTMPVPCCFDRCIGHSGNTSKYPEPIDILRDFLDWMLTCPVTDAVYIMHDWYPSGTEGLNFEMAVQGKENYIWVTKDEREVKRLYQEYNKKYPCDTSEIEENLIFQDWLELPADFHF